MVDLNDFEGLMGTIEYQQTRKKVFMGILGTYEE